MRLIHLLKKMRELCRTAAFIGIDRLAEGDAVEYRRDIRRVSRGERGGNFGDKQKCAKGQRQNQH